MSVLDNQPANKNFLSPLGFKFQIKKTPHLNYFVQSVNLPAISIGTVEIGTPFTKIPFPGDKLTFNQLDVTFKVDEDMENYTEIFDWMIAMGHPDNLTDSATIYSAPAMSGKGVYSDLSLAILTNGMRGNKIVNFSDAFPINLSDITFDSTLSDVEYVTATVTFAYRRFTIASL
jgi:hypothetical protein